MKFTFASTPIPRTGIIVAGVLADRKLTPSAEELDKRTRGRLKKAIAASQFKGNKNQTLTVLAPAGTKLDRIVLVGLGKAKDSDDLAMQNLGGQIYSAVVRAGSASVIVAVDALDGHKLSAAEQAAEVAFGAQLRSYRFDKYRTKEKKSDKPTVRSFKVLCDGPAAARQLYGEKRKIADGVFLTRDLVSEPANILYPESFAEQLKSLTKLGIKVEVLGQAQMKKLGMGALLGVAQGSVREPKLVVMQWNGCPAKIGQKKSASPKPVAFVGKGVCFDTGGISIKPSNGMEDMKWDMGGAGVVAGLMKALAGRKAKANVIGVAGLVENMPDGNAQRPGDIVTSMSGQTIEVLNTDAEGRLVLADAIHYTIERFKPKFVVDLATLTGAIIVALGHEYAGLFANDDKLASLILDSGRKVHERCWRFPLGDEYDKLINTDVADMKNIGSRGGGSITAAQFIQRFVGKTPWVHLDIAGVTWSSKTSPTVPKGGTGFGVRLLDRLIADHYEVKP